MVILRRWSNDPGLPMDQDLRQVVKNYKSGSIKTQSDKQLATDHVLRELGITKSLSDDGVLIRSKDKALRLLKGHVLDAIVNDKKTAEKFNFATVPLKCFNKTMDDILLAFLSWARTEEELYDVPKAFERVEEYATWMHNRREDLRGLTNDSIQPAWNEWNIKVSRDSEGRVVWWMDLAAVGNLEVLEASDSLRLFVWFAHYLLFRHQTQQMGIVVVVNMASVNFKTFVSMLPPKLGRELERLAGILPIKIKHIYVTGSPKWSNVFMSMIKPFLVQDMKGRIVPLENPSDLEEELGAFCVPEGFGQSRVSTIPEEEPVDLNQGTLLGPKDVPLVVNKHHGTLLRDWK